MQELHNLDQIYYCGLDTSLVTPISSTSPPNCTVYTHCSTCSSLHMMISILAMPLNSKFYNLETVFFLHSPPSINNPTSPWRLSLVVCSCPWGIYKPFFIHKASLSSFSASKIMLFIYLRRSFALVYLGQSAMAWSQLTATSASWVQAILLPKPPE